MIQGRALPYLPSLFASKKKKRRALPRNASLARRTENKVRYLPWLHIIGGVIELRSVRAPRNIECRTAQCPHPEGRNWFSVLKYDR